MFPSAEEAGMDRAKEYRELADICRKFATEMDPQDQETLLAMAARWDKLAAEAEQNATS